MSESEKKRRAEYRRNRKKWIMWLTALIVAVSLITLIFFAFYYRMNKSTYITYTEGSDISYSVNYKPNTFFPNGPEEGQGYVSSLVSRIDPSFIYKLHMDSEDIEYEYSYMIEVQMLVKDRWGDILWKPTDTYRDSGTKTQSGKSELVIRDRISIDYADYYAKAEQFVNELELDGASAELNVTMRVNVFSTCESFEGDGTSNTYFTSMKIPMLTQSFGIETTESVGEAEKKILACDKADTKIIFGRLTLIGLGTDIFLALLLLAFIYLTRNTDINYSIKVKKIVSSYKSYIQKINGGFDDSEYQPVFVDTFREMLEIRDTIQSPILMSENEDCTCTRFIIPTGAKLLYIHEIKVDNYNEIYSIGTPTEPTFTEVSIDEPVMVGESAVAEEPETAYEPVTAEVPVTAEEPCTEAFAPTVKSTVSDTEHDEDTDDAELDDESFDSTDFTKYNFSFEARLALSSEEVRGYYSDIVAFVRSYGAKISRSWKRERIYSGRKTYANFVYKGRQLSIALALEPEGQDAKYGFIDMSESGKYEKTPSLMKITSQRKKAYAIELLAAMFAADGIEDKGLDIAPEYVPSRTRSELARLKLIKAEVPAASSASNTAANEITEDIPCSDTEVAEDDTQCFAITEATKEISHTEAQEPTAQTEENINFNEAEEATAEADEASKIADEEIDLSGAELLDMTDVSVDKAEIAKAIAEPDITLEEIDYVSEPQAATEEKIEDGVEVVGLVWPERSRKNKIYMYDPNGEKLAEGDVVLAPSKDEAQNKEIVRKAAVAQANHEISRSALTHPLKKIIGIVKRKAELMLTPSDED